MSFISQITQPDGTKLRVSLRDTEANAVPVNVDGSTVTQPVSAASLPLPSGASTSALQTTGNNSVNSIDGKTPALGQALMAASSPVVIASDQSAVPISGSVSGTFSLSAALPAGTNLIGKVGIDQTTPGTTNAVQPKDMFGWNADCTPNAELITTTKIRLVGTIFNGAAVDPRFWTTSVSTGTVTQANSELVVTSGTAAGHYARVYSVRRANWVTGTSNKFRAQMRIGSSDDDVTLKFGVGWGASMPTVTDGAYFKLVGSTLSVCTMAATSETAVPSGSFNGTYAAPTLTNNNTYEILYTLGKVYFLINNVIVHTATFSTTHWTSGTTNFHTFADSTNTGNSAAIPFTFRMMNIARLGQMQTMSQYYNLTGVAATHVLKLGGGILHKIIFNNTSGTSFIMYDNTAGSGSTIGTITTTSAAVGSWDYECPFFNGLTIVTTGNNLDLTVVYE